MGTAVYCFNCYIEYNYEDEITVPMPDFANKLITEKSPYLQQHAHNPVNWYPWSDEAFSEARNKDRPIFLSIGYSTCHWCHVMEHESFEDPEVARVMNETFISIKVDREERPDLDSFYMKICQLMTGSGGWPMNIIMSPDKVPFLALTYVPKESRGEQIGLIELTERIKEFWKEKKDALIKGGSEALAELMRVEQKKPALSVTPEIREKAFAGLTSMFDSSNGGFGSRPKFPTPHNIMFLFRVFFSTGDRNALEMGVKTLTSMRLGGIYDHVGGGFHRYSTDEGWILPHFEKMTYDQALLSIAYTEGYQMSHNELFRETVLSILRFMTTEMRSQEGGFYSAIDADSDSEEGKFYVWEHNEILRVLGEKDGSLFAELYNVRPDGNYLDEASGRNPGKNVLHLNRTLREEALQRRIEPKSFEQNIYSMLEKLRLGRSKRNPPFKDKKILADINGLMITALVRAYKAFNMGELLNYAIEAEQFIRNKMFEGDRLHHFYMDGFVSPDGFLDDYANVIQSELELFSATGKSTYLEFSLKLAEITDELFEDTENGGYFFSSRDDTGSSVRLKEGYDGAVPSGNSVHMLNLLRLSLITGNNDMFEKAKNIANAFNAEIERGAPFHSYMMIAIDHAISKPYLVTVPDNTPELEKVRRSVWENFFPHAEFVFANSELTDLLAKLNHFIEKDVTKNQISVCSRTECLLPPKNDRELIDILSGVNENRS